MQRISPAHSAPAPQAGKPAEALGQLPEWNLDDLYPGMDSPEFAADLAAGEAECKAFAEAYRGKLEGLLKGQRPEDTLHEAVRLRIQGGSIRMKSLDCPGYASRVLPDWNSMKEMR